MIAQDFFRVRVLASGSIAVAYGAASTYAHTEKRPARARQHSLVPARTSKMGRTSLKCNDLDSFDKRLGEICGLETETFFLWGQQAGKTTLLKVRSGECRWIDLLKADEFRRYEPGRACSVSNVRWGCALLRDQASLVDPETTFRVASAGSVFAPLPRRPAAWRADCAVPT